MNTVLARSQSKTASANADTVLSRESVACCCYVSRAACYLQLILRYNAASCFGCNLKTAHTVYRPVAFSETDCINIVVL